MMMQYTNTSNTARQNIGKMQRSSNLELYRIIVMLLIIAHHYVVNSGLMAPISQNVLAGNSIFLLLLGAWGKTGINCFILITGYFMCTSHITARKYAKLIFEVIFYNLTIYAIFLLTGYTKFSWIQLINAILPIRSIATNFTGCFLAFYLCIPFINIFIKSLSEKQHLLLLILCTGIYIILGSIPTFGVTMNYVTWYTILYFFASYIRRYPRKIFSNTRLWGCVTFLCILLSAGSILTFSWLGAKLGKTGLEYYFLSDSNKILAAATGLSSFLFFSNIKMGHSRLINIAGASTFGVLLIHANSDLMRTWLWQDLLQNVSYFHSPWLVLHAFGSVIGIFVICAVLDYLRIRLIEPHFLALWDKLYPPCQSWVLKTADSICQKFQIETKRQ